MIREMTIDDVEFVYNIHKNSIVHPWSKEMFVNDFKNDNSLYFLLEDEGIIASYISFQIVIDEATIMSIATDSKYRKKGYASLLLKYCFAILKQKDIKKIFLEVRDTNEAAIKLYEKNDFEKMSVRKNYYNNPTCDAIIMIKKI